MHMVICTECLMKFDRDKEPFVPSGARRYMHKKCYDKQQAKLTQNEKDYQALEEYIKKLFNIDTLNKKIINQIKDFRETYGYRYLGMRDTLAWWFEIEGNSIKEANGGIGIVPFVYDQAKEYYGRLERAQAANTQAEIAKYQNKVKKIIIAPPQAHSNKKKLFNLDEEEINE